VAFFSLAKKLFDLLLAGDAHDIAGDQRQE
jgi:hypothetical protein